MFVRYLGGGIGHLEQFPPADNNDKETETATNDDCDTEVEMDDFVVASDAENDDNGEGEENEEVGEEDPEEEDNSDPGEWSDEETGNVY